MIAAQPMHLSMRVADVDGSLPDVIRKLGCDPCVFVSGQYALWRTEALEVALLHEHACEQVCESAWAAFSDDIALFDTRTQGPVDAKEIH